MNEEVPHPEILNQIDREDPNNPEIELTAAEKIIGGYGIETGMTLSEQYAKLENPGARLQFIKGLQMCLTLPDISEETKKSIEYFLRDNLLN